MSTKRLKQYSMLLLGIGVIAVSLSGAGTFATFNAEVANTNNTFATGTLYLHQTHNSTTCTSESASSNANWQTPQPGSPGSSAHFGDQCDILFNGISPVGYDQLGLNMKNAGTLNGTTLTVAEGNTASPYFFAQTGCVSSQSWTSNLGTIDHFNGGGGPTTRSNGASVTEIDLASGIQTALDSGATIQVINGEGQAENFVLTAGEPIGATALPVGAPGPTTVTTAGDLDQGDYVNLTEGSVATFNGSATSEPASTPITSIQVVSPLQVAMYSGAQFRVVEAGDQTKYMTLTTTGVVSAGATSIPVTGNTGSNSFAAGDSVEYSPVFGGGSPAICDSLRLQILEVASPSDYSDITFNPSTGVSSDSDSTFTPNCALGTPDGGTGGCSDGVGLDSVSPPAAGYLHNIPTFTNGSLTFDDLSTAVGGNWDNGTNPRDPGNGLGMDAGTHRYIVLILYLEPPTSNVDQGQIATFDLVWHINQS